MKKLEIKAYRFSVAWTRILPNGTGEVNNKGIEFYNNLIDELIKNGIEPVMTMYHWDLPAELHYRGGWLNPKIADYFEEYAKVIAENFTDRVKKDYYNQRTSLHNRSWICGGYSCSRFKSCHSANI